MASAYLTRTFSSGNRKTYTQSFWVKYMGNNHATGLSCRIADNTAYNIYLDSNSNIDWYVSGGFSGRLKTNRVFRDQNAWYHIVAVVDTTQSTASDRLKLYVNGVQETSFSTANYPSLNEDTPINDSSNTYFIGSARSSDGYLNGSYAHFHFIDGTAYTPSTFGETDATTGIWKPKTSPSVTYGTNGFFLKFDNSGNMGLDSSGQSNNFTTNGTIIQNKDTPSNVFATMNSLIPSTITYSNGNNTIAYGSDYHATFGTLGFTQGKWYYETKIENVSTVTDQYIGIAGETAIVTGATYDATPSVFYSGDGSIHVDGTSTQSSLTSFSGGTILGVAINMDNSQIDFYINGVKQGNTATIPSNSGFYLPYAGGASPRSCSFNFGNGYFGTTAVTSAQNPDDGNGIFEYDVPAGYRALCTKSINAEEYS